MTLVACAFEYETDVELYSFDTDSEARAFCDGLQCAANAYGAGSVYILVEGDEDEVYDEYSGRFTAAAKKLMFNARS